MKLTSKIFVAGHRGLLGSALERVLRANGFDNLILRSKEQLDLRDQAATRKFFRSEKPEYVFLAAAKVGGLQANNAFRAEFILDNLQIQTNVVEEAYNSGVSRLLFIASNCMYPKDRCPMKEEDLLTGELEPTNQPFAVAKIAGVEMCTAYRAQYGSSFTSIVPASLYGPGDNYDLINSHIVPTLIRKCHEAKRSGEREVVFPGSPDRRREMMYVEDAADACLFIMRLEDPPSLVNAGVGYDISVGEIATHVKNTVGYTGEIRFDTTKQSGMMKKLLDSSRIISLGWRPKVGFEEGLKKTYESFVSSSSVE